MEIAAEVVRRVHGSQRWLQSNPRKAAQHRASAPKVRRGVQPRRDQFASLRTQSPQPLSHFALQIPKPLELLQGQVVEIDLGLAGLGLDHIDAAGEMHKLFWKRRAQEVLRDPKV